MYILYLPEAELIFGVIVLLFYEVMERHIVRYHDLNNALGDYLYCLFLFIGCRVFTSINRSMTVIVN